MCVGKKLLQVINYDDDMHNRAPSGEDIFCHTNCRLPGDKKAGNDESVCQASSEVIKMFAVPQ